jgi:hypothetical protein
MSEKLLDKHGREIMRGDILKVDHFIGARRKRYYMYKQCLGITPRGRMEFSSLDFGAHTYTEALGCQRDDYEIVQSIVFYHETRPRIGRATLDKKP